MAECRKVLVEVEVDGVGYFLLLFFFLFCKKIYSVCISDFLGWYKQSIQWAGKMDQWINDVGFPSVCCECVLLALVNKESAVGL